MRPWGKAPSGGRAAGGRGGRRSGLPGSWNSTIHGRQPKASRLRPVAGLWRRGFVSGDGLAIEISLVGLLILLNGFFAGAEIAVIAARRAAVRWPVLSPGRRNDS